MLDIDFLYVLHVKEFDVRVRQARRALSLRIPQAHHRRHFFCDSDVKATVSLNFSIVLAAKLPKM